jgi:putative spermidine/putrescine transport system substrate-binding protein
MKSVTKVLAPVAVVALSLAVAGCGGSSGVASSGNDKALTLYSSGDVNVQSLWRDTLIPAFQKDNPGYSVKLVFSEHGTNDATTLAKLGASVKQQQDPGMDLIDAGLVGSAAQAGLLEKVSADQIPNLAKVDQTLLQPVNDSAVPYRGSAVVLAYNSEKVANPPKTLDELLGWIKANPGKFTYNSPGSGGSGHALVETVLDKYMPASAVQKMANQYLPDLESQWAQGLQALHDLNADINQHVYPNGNQAVLDLLSKGTITMAPVWSDQSLTAKKSGLLTDNIKFLQIANPSFTGSTADVGIPANSKHKAAAEKLANWILQPGSQKLIVDKLAGYPGIELKYMAPDVQHEFAGVNTSQLRNGYETKTANDVNREWQAKVPG